MNRDTMFSVLCIAMYPASHSYYLDRSDRFASRLCVAHLPLSSESRFINIHLVLFSFVVSTAAVLSAVLQFKLTASWSLLDVAEAVGSFVAKESVRFLISSAQLNFSFEASSSYSKASLLSALLSPESSLRVKWQHLATNLIVFQLGWQEQYIKRENILIYGEEEDKEDSDDGKMSCSQQQMSSKLISNLMIYREYPTSSRTTKEKQEFMPNHCQVCVIQKRNKFLTNTRNLKNIEGRQHVFVCKDLTPLRHKLLKYMQKSCCDTFTTCYTRNGNMKAHLKTSGGPRGKVSGNWPLTHLWDPLNGALFIKIPTNVWFGTNKWRYQQMSDSPSGAFQLLQAISRQLHQSAWVYTLWELKHVKFWDSWFLCVAIRAD